MNFENFIKKAQEFTKKGVPEGKSCVLIETETAKYFGMSLKDYRKTMAAATKARLAQRSFEVNYYMGTHPDATVANTAAALNLPEVLVRAVNDTK